MKYALIHSQRTEAFLKGRAECPTCGSVVIAKCGTQKIHHWAHLGQRNCDTWAEKETEWHRAWKNNFPQECQEFVMRDERSGEKHIADVRNEHGLVIEFQHSPIDPKEQAAREAFYRNMVWVVDGVRLKKDVPRFLEGIKGLRMIANGYFLVPLPEKFLPRAWLDSSALVFFDFQGVAPLDPPDPIREGLWCLLPGRAGGNAVIVAVSRSQFIEIASSKGRMLEGYEKLMADIDQALEQPRRNTQAAEHRRQQALLNQQFQRRPQRRTFRRF